MATRLTLIPLLLLTASALAQQPAPAAQPAESRWFETPVAVAQGRRVVAFEFPIAGSRYRIARTGLGNRSDGQTLNLHLSKGDFIEKLYYTEYKGDALLLIEVSNGVYAVGFLARIGGAVPDIRWKQTIPGFNVGRGLVEGDSAYVTALRFVAKVDLRSGAYIWRHSNLQHGGVFDAFDPPALDGERVVFPAYAFRGKQKMTIAVDKQTGRILEPSFFAQPQTKKKQ